MKQLVTVLTLLFLLAGCQPTDEPTPITCSDGEVLDSGVCIPVVTCETNQTLINGECVDNIPECESPEVLRDNECVIIPDPVITLTGSLELTIEAGSEYVDPGVSAVYDGTEIEVTMTGLESTRIPGTYTLTYHATSEDGKEAPIQTRTVHVIDTTPPVIVFSEDDEFTHELGRPFPYDSVLVTDNSDSYENITITIEGSVDVNVLGTYDITYLGTDSHGNQSQPITKTVEVIDVNNELAFTERYLTDHTALYNPLKMVNNYTYGPIEWVHQALVIENGEYVPKLFFFLHNEIDGEHVLKRIDFICSTGNIEHILDDDIIDYAFEMPIDCMTGSYLSIITYGHDDSNAGQKWTASMYIPPDNRSVEGILKKRLENGNLM